MRCRGKEGPTAPGVHRTGEGNSDTFMSFFTSGPRLRYRSACCTRHGVVLVCIAAGIQFISGGIKRCVCVCVCVGPSLRLAAMKWTMYLMVFFEALKE